MMPRLSGMYQDTINLQQDAARAARIIASRRPYRTKDNGMLELLRRRAKPRRRK